MRCGSRIRSTGRSCGRRCPSRARTSARCRLARLVGARADRSRDDALRIARWLLDAGEPIPVALGLEAAGGGEPAGDAGAGRAARPARARRRRRRRGGAAARALLRHAQAFDEAEAVLAGVEDDRGDQDARDRLPRAARDGAVLGPAAARATRSRCSRARRDWWPDAAWRRRIEPRAAVPLAWSTARHGARRDRGDARRPGARAAGAPAHGDRPRRRTCSSAAAPEACALALRLRPPVPLRDAHDELALDVCCLSAARPAEDLRRARRVDAGDDRRGRPQRRPRGGRDRRAWRWASCACPQGATPTRGAGSPRSIVHFERRDPFGYLALRARHAGRRRVLHRRRAPAPRAAMERYRAALGDREVRDTERPYLARAEAWGLLAEGDARGAQRLLIDAAERCSSDAVLRRSTSATRRCARARRRARWSTPVAELRERCDARLAAAYADHLAARAAGDGAALLRVAERARRHRHPPLRGRERRPRRGGVRRRRPPGLGPARGGALPRAARARPGRLAPADPRHRRRGRRAQPARGAARRRSRPRGLANAEIADRLVLSVRTVESHIYRAMQKLGVSDRRDL